MPHYNEMDGQQPLGPCNPQLSLREIGSTRREFIHSVNHRVVVQLVSQWPGRPSSLSEDRETLLSMLIDHPVGIRSSGRTRGAAAAE